MTWLYDSHIHLSDPEFRSDIKQIIHTMDLLSLRACCVSMDFETSVDTLDLSKKSENILPFIGIHPEMAQGDSSEVLDMIEKRNNEITGIGEIGLDRTYITTEEEWIVQKKVFSDQLSLAEKFNKPVSIHSRKTLDEIFEILSSFNLKRILLHWFDGNKKQLKQAMDLEYYVSFGPVMTYSKDKQVLLSKTDKNRILVETDGPVRFSRCFGNKIAQIDFIPSVVFCASKVLHMDYDDLCNVLEQNSKQYLML